MLSKCSLEVSRLISIQLYAYGYSGDRSDIRIGAEDEYQLHKKGSVQLVIDIEYDESYDGKLSEVLNGFDIYTESVSYQLSVEKQH